MVDFSNTTFIDSTTLGVLVGGVKRLRTNDGQLSLVCSDRNITKIFEITGLDRVFTIYPTRAEAVEQITLLGVVRAGAAVLVLLAASAGARGCGTGGIVKGGDSRHGKQLFLAEVRRLPHARGRGHARHGRAEPRRRLRLGPAAGLRAR